MTRFEGRELKRLRKAKGLSRFKLAVAIGMTPQTVQNWEQGTHVPGGEALAKLAEALGCQVESFFVKEGEDA